MSKEDIITVPNPALRRHSQKVGLITDDIKKIVRQMQDSVIDWEQSREHEVGVALAAPQINKLYKIIVIRNDFNNKDDHTFSVFINPVITKYEGTVEADFEGCLSVRDIYGKVPRYSKIRVKALDLQGKPFSMKIEGFAARILQHEIDHLQGKLFIDHIKGNQEAFYRLMPDGKLQQLDYEKDVRHNSVLW
jgi:peptide deformylase